MSTNRKLILYIAMSMDGFITDRNEELGFLSMVEEEGQDYGYYKFVESVDTIIIGRKTYEKVLSMGYEYPHTDKEVYIITRTERPPIGSFTFYNGNLNELVSKLKSEPRKNIYCDGGAELVNELLSHKLIDECIISIVPILLGDGIRLFKNGLPEQKMKLISSENYNTGMVQVHYEILKG